MSVVTKLARQSLKIVALPLTTTPRTPLGASSCGHLTYYHFFTPPPKDENKGGPINWATTKTLDLWASFGTAPEGSWKRRTYLYGEHFVDRIDFEEFALRSLDPSLGPKPKSFSYSEPDIVEPGEHPRIPLIYPSSICSSPLEHLKSLLHTRGPLHRKSFYRWMLLTPLTAPLKLIPIIPNLPFFFCVWRSWAHYKAYSASSYLEQLLSKGAIVPEASNDLDRVYAKYATTPTPLSATPRTEQTPSRDLHSDPSSRHRRLLLTQDAIPDLLSVLNLKPDSAFVADMHRALEQAALRLEKAEPDSKPQ